MNLLSSSPSSVYQQAVLFSACLTLFILVFSICGFFVFLHLQLHCCNYTLVVLLNRWKKAIKLQVVTIEQEVKMVFLSNQAVESHAYLNLWYFILITRNPLPQPRQQYKLEICTKKIKGLKILQKTSNARQLFFLKRSSNLGVTCVAM